MWGADDEVVEAWGLDDEEVAEVDAAAQMAATAAGGDKAPTVRQMLAGNYQKGHVVLNALDISIENPEGSTRYDLRNDPPKWRTLMKHHYGDLRGTIGMDGDPIDVFLKPGTPTDWYGTVFIIDQVLDGEPDEHKVMLGFDSEAEAREAYLSNYQKGWRGLGAITAVAMDDFKEWLKGDTSVPFAADMEAQAEEEESVGLEDATVPRELTDDEAFAGNYAALEGLIVEEIVLVEHTEKTATLRMDAAQALRALDARISAVKALAKCLARRPS